MQNFINALKRNAAQQDTLFSHPQFGTVQSYDPNTCEAKVMLQPQNLLTGWLPVSFPTVGNGIGVICPPNPGQQVIVVFEGGDVNSGVILGGSYSLQSAPPKGFNSQPVQSGEIALINNSGHSLFHMLTNGNICMQAGSNAIVMPASGNIMVTGTLVVSGDVIAGSNNVSLVHHVNTGVQSGTNNSGPPL